MNGELAALDWLRRRLPPPPPGETWLGDDAAVVRGEAGWVLLAADLVVAGVHADLTLVTAADAGWKALVANVSDLAAMGGRPGYALVSVAGPADTDLALLYAGLGEAAERYRCPIVGGDLSSAPALVVSVAVTGTVPAAGPPPVLRSGAAPGDAVLVTGALGASAAGLAALRRGERGAPVAGRHARPPARVAEGWAARRAGASAMIDVSDGLALDAWRVAQASGVGIALDTVPVAEGASLEDALGGGEDYELVIAAADPDAVAAAFRGAGLAAPVVIGRCTDRSGELTLAGEPLEPGGYEHPWGPPPAGGA